MQDEPLSWRRCGMSCVVWVRYPVVRRKQRCGRTCPLLSIVYLPMRRCPRHRSPPYASCGHVQCCFMRGALCASHSHSPIAIPTESSGSTMTCSPWCCNSIDIHVTLLSQARNSLAVLRECTWRDKWPPAYGDGFGSTNGNSRAAMQLLVPALLACVVALVIRNMYSKCQRASKSSALGASSVEARCHHTSARPQASSTSKGVAGVLGKNRGRRGTALSPPFTMLAPDCGEAAGVELKGVSRPILRAGRSMVSAAASPWS